MRNPRPLTDEEKELLSAPVEKPTAQWDTYQETGALRPLEEPEMIGGPWAAFHGPEERPNLRGFTDPWGVDESAPTGLGWTEDTWAEPVARTLWNIPGGAARGIGEFAATVSPFHIGKEIGRRAYIATTAHKMAGEDDRLYRYYHDLFLEHTDSQLTEAQQDIVGIASEVIQATSVNPYDPGELAVRGLQQNPELYPRLHALGQFVESVLPVSLISGEYNLEFSENISRLVQEESGEFALETGLSVALGGSSAVGALRRTTGRAVQGVGRVVEDIVDPAGQLQRWRERSATVELDYARRGGFARGAMGGVIEDPETGRRFVSTAAHSVVGQRGEPLSFMGIRARTGEGEIGTIQGVSAIDLERDIALLEVSGLTQTLDVADMPLESPHRLLGREGVGGDARLVGESGATIEMTTATGVAGESGVPLLSQEGSIGGLYLGMVGDQGLYAPGGAVRELIGEVGDNRIRLGHELSQRALREGLHHRSAAGDTGVFVEGIAPRTGVFVPEEIAAPSILFPQFQLAGRTQEDVQLHSLGGEWNIADWDWDYEDRVGVKEVEFYHPNPVEVKVQGRVTGTDPATRYERVPVEPSVKRSGEIDPTYGNWKLQDIRPKGSNEPLDVENWTWQQLQLETYYGDYYRASRAREEMGKRLTSQRSELRKEVSPHVARERELWEAQNAATRQQREEMREAGIESDFDAEGHFVPMSNPDAPRDYTETYDPQDYQKEAFESADVTGEYSETWVDEHGDFPKEDIDTRTTQTDQYGEHDFEDTSAGVVPGVEPGYEIEVPLAWIAEYGTRDQQLEAFGEQGTLVGDPLDSEKVSSLEAYQSTGSVFLPETQRQLDEMFSGFIEAQQPVFEPRVDIVRRMDVRDPDWRRKMRAAVQQNRTFQTEQLSPFYQEAIGRQEPGWEARAKELWFGGEFEAYYHHVEPVRLDAYRRYQESQWEEYETYREVPPEPYGMPEVAFETGTAAEYSAASAWTESLSSMFAEDVGPTMLERGTVQRRRVTPGPTDDEILSRRDERRRQERAHPARLPELYQTDMFDMRSEVHRVLWGQGYRGSHLLGEAFVGQTQTRLSEVLRERSLEDERFRGLSQEAPLAIRQAQAAALERPLLDPADARREQIFWEEAGIDTETYKDPNVVEDIWYEPGVLPEGGDPDALAWHQEQVAESALIREGHEQSNLRHAGLTERPVEIVEEIVTLGDAEKIEREMVVGRKVSARYQRQHELQVEHWRRAESQRKRQAEDPAFASLNEAIEKELRKKTERARRATLRDLGKDPDLHSLDEDVFPLDTETPRGWWRGFGIGSQRTYGVELELITDISRSDLEGELEWEVGHGLRFEYDTSIRTARSDVAVVHQPGPDERASAMHLYGEELRDEAADYLRYQGQYTDTQGYQTVFPEDFDERYAHELVFPVMRGSEGLDFLGETLDTLSTFETELNTSMGLHVHVGAQDLSNYDLVGLWGAFAARENVIDLMHEPSRRGVGHTYAESLLASREGLDDVFENYLRGDDVSSRADLDEVRSRLYDARRESLLSSENRETFLNRVGYGDRYQKLNLRGFEHQTIEYRQPAPTLDIGEVEGHIRFITDFVDEFAGKPLEWAFERDPRLQEDFAGLDLSFERPGDRGQLILPIDLHSSEKFDPKLEKGFDTESSDQDFSWNLSIGPEEREKLKAEAMEIYEKERVAETSVEERLRIREMRAEFEQRGGVTEEKSTRGWVDDLFYEERLPQEVDKEAVARALERHRSPETEYRIRHQGMHIYARNVPGQAENELLGFFTEKELAERQAERHARLRSHIRQGSDTESPVDVVSDISPDLFSESETVSVPGADIVDPAFSTADPLEKLWSPFDILSPFDEDVLLDLPTRSRPMGVRQRWDRFLSESQGERGWGGFTGSVAEMAQNTALINVAASLTVEGVRMFAGHDLNPGSLMHAGASMGVAGLTTLFDRRFGSRGVLPESPADFAERREMLRRVNAEASVLGETSESIPEGAASHLNRIFSEAGAGTARWGRGSLSRELSRYTHDDLNLMFGEAGTETLLTYAEQTRRFGQKSHQTQRDWSETLLGIFSGDIPRARRYAYDPESREVNIETGKRLTLDRLLSATERYVPGAEAWRMRRDMLRLDPSQDNRLLRTVFGPLQAEDAKPHVGYMFLPESRGIGRFFGRFHAEPEGAKRWNLEDITRAVGADAWADRIAERKNFRRARGEILEERRLTPELYQWQDAEHFYREISGTLGIDVDSFEGFGSPRLASPYSRFGRHFSRLPRSAELPLATAGGLGGGYLGYELFFGGDDDELVLDDPAGYSLSPRYPILGAIQRTRPYRRLRARAENLLDDLYGEDSFHGEMLKSIVLGKKGNLPQEVKQTFVQTGQIHALVQSGMHVSMFSSLLGRYPALAAPAAFSAARDLISPPNERVVEPSQDFWDKFRPSDDPWTPRWNPELPTQGQIRAFQSRGLLPDDYELEIPEAPSWAWWDPEENYWKDEARRGRRLASDRQVEALRSRGLLPEDYEHVAPEWKDVELKRRDPGIQDVLPWAIYGMFGVVPETAYSYFQTERAKESYNIGAFEFDVHESPFPGFNPWLDPSPEGDTGLPEDEEWKPLKVALPPPMHKMPILDPPEVVEREPIVGSKDDDLSELYTKLGIDISDGLSREEANLLMEHHIEQGNYAEATKAQVTALTRMYPEINMEGISKDLASQLFDAYEGYKEGQPKMATEKQITALTRMYPDQDLTGLTMDEASGLFDSYEPPLKMATERQITALMRMYPDLDLTGLTMDEASGLFDAYEPGSKMASERQITALTRMYPDKDLTGLTMDAASKLFDTYEPPPKMASDRQVTALTRMYPDKDLTGLTMDAASKLFDEYVPPPKMATERQITALTRMYPDQDLTGLTMDEASNLFDTYKRPPKIASDRQIAALARMYPDRDLTGLTMDEASELFDTYERSAPSDSATSSQLSALGRIYGGGISQPQVEPANYLNVNISDGITKQEASHLFASAEVGRELQGPPMASQAQVSALQRIFPQMFEGAQMEEEPLVPLEQIEFVDSETGRIHVTREEARQAFRHVKESPPPMASARQVARLQMEFPEAFKQLGRAETYLESGESYGIVKSLEDIYDADTFTGRLYDAPSGQTFKEDTVRLGDFNAPEIRPDRMKPREYQEREAARARQARDVFRSMVERFNVGRDVEEEGYVIPIEFRQDSSMPGGLERGFYGRVLGDVNFEGIDYEQFMIQQGMGSVYGADVEWGAAEIDPFALWRREPTLLQGFGEGVTGTLSSIPVSMVSQAFQGKTPIDSFESIFKQTPAFLKNLAVSQAQRVAGQATEDLIKERILGMQTPSDISFVQRYIGDFSGLGERFGGFGEKAGGFFQGGWGAAIAPIALAAGTAWIGEQSLDRGYADVIPSQQQREQAFTDYLLGNRDEIGAPGSSGSEMGVLRVMKKALREVLSENGLASMGDFSTRLSRELRESDSRGITRRGR